MRRLSRLLITLIMAVTVAATGGTALAAPVPGGTARDTSTAVLHLQTAAGCGGGSVSIKVLKTYDSNGRLKTVYATATSKVTCSSGLAAFMYNTASVEKNGVVVKTGKTSSCDNPPNCTLTYSSISWLCTARPGHRSYVFCYGYYRAEAHYVIILVHRYEWIPPAPKGCEISSSDPHRLTCTEYSPSVYVSETG